jgi:hypothetical protein
MKKPLFEGASSEKDAVNFFQNEFIHWVENQVFK